MTWKKDKGPPEDGHEQHNEALRSVLTIGNQTVNMSHVHDKGNKLVM